MDHPHRYVELGLYLRWLRMQQRLTQEALATDTNLSRETIVRMEQGYPTMMFQNVASVWRRLSVSPSIGLLLTQPEAFSWVDALHIEQTTTALLSYIAQVTGDRESPRPMGEAGEHAHRRAASSPILTELTLLQTIIAENLRISDIAEILLANDPQRVAVRHAEFRREVERQRVAETPANMPSYPLLSDAIRDLRVVANRLYVTASPYHVTIRHIADDLDQLRMVMNLPFTIHPNR